MSQQSTAGKKAYRDARIAGKSKSEAKQASITADNEYYQKVRDNQMKYAGIHNSDPHAFDNGLNDGRWHTAEDL